ncbi:hypothetical protein [Vibrio cholerae]|uniref:hypothetical protein n=1 Tax=Vibrio cholerae TaxID=666 RepID=UPI000841E514|nr:hypothetical protein [Vibrio cholerae]
MIDISWRLSQQKKDFHFNGFHRYIKNKFYKAKINHRIKPIYSFEKKFYRYLLQNIDFTKSILFCGINDLISIEKNDFYKNHRLYFLFCMKKEIRMSGVFYSHFMKESKNFPRDVAKDIAIYGVEKVSSDIRSRCEKVFNYNFFIKVNKKNENDTTLWNAYNYVFDFSPKACPYCNLELTTNLQECLSKNSARYILRPALDHFIAQSIFPFYALCINNLVPSCSTCNSNLKKDTDFINTLHISPMGESFKNRAKFGIALVDDDLIINAIDDLYNENKINLNNFKLVIESECNKSKQNIKTFELLKRYNNHSEMYKFFLENLPKVRPEKIEMIMNFFDTMNESEAVQRLLHHELDEMKHCDIPMSIMKQDLINRYIEN